jgi:MFS family permease
MAVPKNESGVVAAVGQGTGFLSRFAVLKGAVRELWIVFGAKLLAILAYGVMNSTIILWLSSDLGYSDERAGYLVAVWSTVMTLSTVLVGSLVDAIGLRKAMLVGFGVCLVSRGVMAFAGAKWLALPFGLFLVAVGESMLTPVMVAAVKRYATTAQRSISFSIFYAMMNLGFGIGAWIFDSVRLGLGEHGSMVLPWLGVELTTYRTLFLVSFALTLPNLALVYFFLRDGVEATDEGVVIKNAELRMQNGKGGNILHGLCEVVVRTVKETVRIFSGLWQQRAFYKFLIFLSLVVAVRLIFYHMYYTYPKFGIRELGATATTFSKGEIRNVPDFAVKLKRTDALSVFLSGRFSEELRSMVAAYPGASVDKQALQGKLLDELNGICRGESIYEAARFAGVKLHAPTKELLGQNPSGDARVRLNRRLLEDAYPNYLGAGAPIGRLWSVNAFVIVLLVPIVGALTQRIAAYRMLVVGSFISAASVFIMALPPAWFQGVADGWLGNLVAHVWLGVEGAVNPYYVMIFVFVLVLSVGESLWSPRLYEYTAAVAPKGQEASYMSLSYLPYFLAKLVVGMFSGNLLARYCPETGPRDSQTLWLIIALMTMITPVGLLVLRKFIQVKEAGRT